MAASVLNGVKICEVSGKVKSSSLERFVWNFESGSIALYKLSSSFYIHAITKTKTVKYLLKADKFTVVNRDSKLTLSIMPDDVKNSVSIYVRDAVPDQLQIFLAYLNGVKAHIASLKGKLSSFPSRENSIQDIENQPHNSMNTNISSPGGSNYLSPLRSDIVSSSTHSTPKVTPNRPPNYFAKQTSPPSSYNSQNKKTPLLDQTRARDNLSNTSSSVRSASSFYGNNSSRSPSERRSTLGPGLMPPPRPRSQTLRLASQITFRSRDKHSFEKEVTLTGFSNLGNTCYMNAILQSLLGVPPFVQDLSNRTLLDRVHPQCLYRCLYSVMLYKRKCGNPDVLKTSLKKLKRTISEAATRFSGYHQHDAHEFLCQVFDQLRDDVSTCNSPSSKTTPKESNSVLTDSQCPVTRSFESGVLHTISCKQCGESAPKEEIYHAFSLDIPTLCNSPAGSSPFGAVNMQTLIEKHFEDEELEYTCSKCESKEAVISHSFSQLPRVLVLHLKRYEYDNLTEEQAKKQDKVNIERFINLRMLCSSKTKAPLTFQPKSSFKMSPPKSNQKPQKRHFISEDDDDEEDDDDSNDFQPSRSVRRKLDHSFLNTTTTTSPSKNSSPIAKTYSRNDMEITKSCKPKMMDECIRDPMNTDEEDCTEGDANNKENNSDVCYSGSERPVWEGTEEEQMNWALTESAKSAEKKSGVKLRAQHVNESELECTGKPDTTAKDSLSNTRITCSSNDDEVTEICNGRGAIKTSKEDCTENNLNVKLPACEKPVWRRTEEEQVEWALAESAKSAEKISRAELRPQRPESEIEQTENYESLVDLDNDFVVISDVSDEDLVSAALESGTDEPMGLKGGAPIATQNCLDDAVTSGMNKSTMVNDEISAHKNCGVDFELEQNTEKPFVIKNTPIMCIKRKNSNLHRKRKSLTDSPVLNKTPTLEKFDGNLFDDVPNEERTSGVNPSNVRSSSTKFRDEDMEKAINMSLQEQQIFSEEDEELKRVLQLSLQEFEGKCPAEDQPAFPEHVDIADTENVTDSIIQDEESDLSTHSYRLVSIVSHLGFSSTSGHYISDVYDCKTKQWTSYDDSTASKVTEHSVRYKRQQSGYIFFYMYKQCVDAIENSSPSKEKKIQ